MSFALVLITHFVFFITRFMFVVSFYVVIYFVCYVFLYCFMYKFTYHRHRMETKLQLIINIENHQTFDEDS